LKLETIPQIIIFLAVSTCQTDSMDLYIKYVDY